MFLCPYTEAQTFSEMNMNQSKEELKGNNLTQGQTQKGPPPSTPPIPLAGGVEVNQLFDQDSAEVSTYFWFHNCFHLPAAQPAIELTRNQESTQRSCSFPLDAVDMVFVTGSFILPKGRFVCQRRNVDSTHILNTSLQRPR